MTQGKLVVSLVTWGDVRVLQGVSGCTVACHCHGTCLSNQQAQTMETSHVLDELQGNYVDFKKPIKKL